MNIKTMRQLVLLLWLVPIAAWSQQPSAPSPTDAAPQAITNQNTSSVQLKTADGVAACPAELISKPVMATADKVHHEGGNLLQPKPIYTPDAKFSDEARKYARKFMKEYHIKSFEAMSILKFVVDINGTPQDICVAKEAGNGLDRNAVETVAKWRFQPATRDGKPVPVRLTTEVDFKLH
jgi:TonB family protein